MSKNLRGRHWLVGCVVGASLLGACGAPQDEGSLPAAPESQASLEQELSAEAELRNVTVSLSTAQSAFSASESARVTVTLRNTGSSKVKLLKWELPEAEELEESLFTVKRDGQPMPYLGAHYKRGAARAEDVVQLKPGESLTRTVDLARFYDLSKSGTYSIRFEDSHGGHAGALRSNELSLWIEGRQSGPVADEGPITVASSVAFSKCDATQQSTLLQAVSASSTMANDSVNHLAGTPSGTPRYTTWFGAYSSSGWSTAKSQFAAIKDALDNKPLTIDCGCKKTYYAYVYPNQPYKIYVCKAFWAAPMTGTDSKGGTLIHELSHFTAVAGTDDWVYGQSGAKSLASSDPTKALNNADNHEYFAENTPFLQ